MFDRVRIGGALYNLADSLTADGAPVSRKAVKDWTDELMDSAVRDMKQHHLTAEQAAVALVINLVNRLHSSGMWDRNRTEQSEHFISLIRLYHGACRLKDQRPDHFARAEALFDEDVFEATFA